MFIRNLFIKAVGVFGLCLAVTALNGCNRTPAPAPSADPSTPSNQKARIGLSNATDRWGIDFTYRNGEDQQQFTILESLGGGVGVIDFDRDGHQDLFCTGGGSFDKQTIFGFPAQLFRNINGKKMAAVGLPSGVAVTPPHYSHGAFVSDFDSDGFPDVLITGYGGLQLWHNLGDGTFQQAQSDSKLDDKQWSSGAGWGDFNNDGSLDLYVAHYVNWSFDNHPFCPGRKPGERDICPPREYEGIRDTLYLSNGDGTFRDCTEEYQLSNVGSKGLGVLVSDFDGNGLVDIYVANDTTNNYLYINEGQAPFREVAQVAGVAADKAGIPNGSMGLDVFDFDHNGRPDIWVTNYEREDFALYRNEGGLAFLHVSDIMGLNVLGGLFVGFGTVCTDLDFDGEEDIVVNNGHVIRYPTASPRKQTPVVMRREGKRFNRVSYDTTSYLMQPQDGRGLAAADLDSDGDSDLVFSSMNSSVAIIENLAPSNNNWLQVRLVGRQSNRDAIGASVTLKAASQTHVRFRKGGGSYMSTSQESLSFGLGTTSKIDSLEVRWPSGRISQLETPTCNQSLTVVEPDQ